jgi:hypothetical protein
MIPFEHSPSSPMKGGRESPMERLLQLVEMSCSQLAAMFETPIDAPVQELRKRCPQFQEGLG